MGVRIYKMNPCTSLMTVSMCSTLRWLIVPFLLLSVYYRYAQAIDFARYDVSEETAETSHIETVVLDPGRMTERYKRDDTGNSDDINDEYIKDNHDYYTSTYYSDAVEKWWIDLESNETRHESLSTSLRRAAVIPLKFTFNFYGHNLSSVVITTGGFLYVGAYLHPYLAESQYISPLMANFDLSSDNISHIKYNDDGNVFTAEWHGIQLKDADAAQQGRFTFQVSIHSDSKIVFAYKEVPVLITNIPNTGHPVKAGIADAYYNDIRLAPNKIRREIHQYHAVRLNTSRIISNAVVVLEPLPTCNILHSCQSCENSKIGFNCTWCTHLNRCSDGMDRNRQEWLDNHCENKTINTPCVFTTPETRTTSTISSKPGEVKSMEPSIPPSKTGGVQTTSKTMVVTAQESKVTETSPTSSKSIVTACILVIGILSIGVVVIVVWVVYAYRNPTTKSGQFLIQLQRNRRGERKDKTVKYKYQRTDGMSSVHEDGLSSLKDDVDI